MITEVRGFTVIFDDKDVTENSKAFDKIVGKIKEFGEIGEHDAIRVDCFGNTHNFIVRGKDINTILRTKSKVSAKFCRFGRLISTILRRVRNDYLA